MSGKAIYPMTDAERQLALARWEERERELIARGITPDPAFYAARKYIGTFTYIP